MNRTRNLVPLRLFLSLATAALLTATWCNSASARFGTPPPIAVSATITPTSASEGILRVEAKIPQPWNIYSVTQTRNELGGPLKTEITLDAGAKATLTGPFVPDSKPEVSSEDYLWNNLPIEKQKGTVVFSAPIRAAAGTSIAGLEVRGKLVGQACDPSSCVDISFPFRAVAASSVPETSSPRITHFASVVVPRLPGVTSYSTSTVTFTGEVIPASVVPGNEFTLKITATPKTGWHIYARTEKEADAGGISKPTLIPVSGRSGLQIAQPETDSKIIEHKVEFLEGVVDRYHEGEVTWTFKGMAPSSATSGNKIIGGAIGFQLCNDQGCDRPTGANFSVNVGIGGVGPSASPVHFVASDYGQASALAEKNTWDELSQSVPTPQPKTAAAVGTFPWARLFVNLGWAFLAGMILNVMPCVLPVIGLKVLSFVQQAGEDRKQIFLLNLWYSAGIILVFLVLATLPAFLGWTWSQQFQRPEFGIALTAVVFVFALSLLGVWEIPLPGFVGTSKTQQLADREGPSGAFFKGILTTLLATPCAGPLMFVVMGFALGTKSVPTIFAIFLAMGVGMASPYLLIGVFPAMVRVLPKPGAWMETFKHLIGFMLLATVLFLFVVIAGLERGVFVLPTLSLLFALWFGCWMFGRVPLTANTQKKMTGWAVSLLVTCVLSVAMFTGMRFAQAILIQDVVEIAHDEELNVREAQRRVWVPFTPQRLQEYQAEGATVLVDFTATWCLTCQINKGTSLHTEATKKYMREQGIIGLIADKSEDAPDVDALLSELGNPGGTIPFYAVFPASGGEPILLDGVLTGGRLLAALEQAGPSTTQPVIQTAQKQN